MKQLLIIALLLSTVTCFAQKGKGKPGRVNHKADTAAVVAHQVDSLTPNNQLPPGTTVIFLSPQQVQVLQYVMDMSEAGHKDVLDITRAIQRQQYTIPAPPARKDSTAATKPISDSTAAKH